MHPNTRVKLSGVVLVCFSFMNNQELSTGLAQGKSTKETKFLITISLLPTPITSPVLLQELCSSIVSLTILVTGNGLIKIISVMGKTLMAQSQDSS